MTLVSDIIRDAFRESNLLAISADPTAAEQAEGLRLLNRLVTSCIGNEMGEQLDPLAIGRNNINRPQGWPWYDNVPDQTQWFVPSNTRLVLNLTAPLTVYLDPQPMDGTRFALLDKSNNLATNGLTVMPNGQTIMGTTSLVAATNGSAFEFIYRSDTGDWAKTDPLLADDDMPFPTDFDDYFIIGLASRLNVRNANAMDPQSVEAYNNAKSQFRARYRQSKQMASELALVRTDGTKRRYYDDTRMANGLFNSGWASPYGGYRW